MVAVIPADARADAGAFLVRLLRLDPAAVVRLRPSGDRIDLWARLPFDVLVTRSVTAPFAGDLTLAAADLFAAVEAGVAPAGTARRDHAWRWPLPPDGGRVVELLPAEQIGRLASLASQTLRSAVTDGVGGRAVGERVLRDALLDHVPLKVTGDDGEQVEVPQRLVQGLVRMGFLGRAATATLPVGSPENFASTRADLSPDRSTEGKLSVTVRRSGPWIGLGAAYGSAWYRRSSPFRLQVR